MSNIQADMGALNCSYLLYQSYRLSQLVWAEYKIVIWLSTKQGCPENDNEWVTSELHSMRVREQWYSKIQEKIILKRYEFRVLNWNSKFWFSSAKKIFCVLSQVFRLIFGGAGGDYFSMQAKTKINSGLSANQWRKM